MQHIVRHDLSHYPRLVSGPTAPLWWGMVGLILILLTFTVCLFAAYFYLQIMNEQWPPPEAVRPDLLAPSLVVAGLLLAAVLMAWSGKALAGDRLAQSKLALALSLLPAACALVLLAGQLSAFGLRWDEHVYGSIVWTLLGFHLALLGVALLSNLLMLPLALLGFFNAQRRVGSDVMVMYWYFVALSWIPSYVLLYWLPRWL